MEKLNVVGSRIPPIDGFRKVTGEAKYASDIRLPHTLVGLVLRSPSLQISAELKRALPLAP